MDSGNSGSLQSSSGGAGGGGTADDQDFDSRTESMSSFLNISSSSSHHHRNQTLNSTFFDPSSASFYPSLNPGYDPVWSRNLRPDPSFTGFGEEQNDGVYLNSQQGMFSNQSPPVTGRFSDHRQVGVAMKSPKKRTRASRRAPTTVLTTDTTNFRQMVQEFTGIPTAPFSAASPLPYSRRLDLYGGGGIGPLFPVRPLPQKIQLQADASSSSYQLPPSEIQGLQNQPRTLLNSQNPLFSFQYNQASDLLSGFQSSSRRWRGQNENLVSFDGAKGNTPKLDGYNLNSLDFDHQTE